MSLFIAQTEIAEKAVSFVGNVISEINWRQRLGWFSEINDIYNYT